MDWIVEITRAGIENVEQTEVKNRKAVGTVLASIVEDLEDWEGPAIIAVFPDLNANEREENSG